MDLQSYIQLKEACSLASHSQNLSESVGESVDSIWEEVEAFAHALVEEEGVDLSDMTWDEVREAYLEERMGRVSNSKQNTSGQAAQTASKLARTAAVNTRTQNASGQGGKSIASNPNRRGVKPTKRPADMQRGKVYGDASPKPAPAKAQPQAAKPQPQAAPPKAKPAPAKSTINDLKSRMPTPAKPSGASAGASSIGAATANARPTATAIKSNRLRAALDSARKPAPMKEETDFDLVLEHLIDSGFGPDEALTFMVNMSEEKRQEILEMRHRDAKTGEVTDKPEIGKTYYPEGPRTKSSVALRKEKEASEKKKTRKEEDESLYQAYLSMMSEGEQPNIEYLNRYGGHPEVKSKKKKKTPFEKENPGHSDDKPTARFTKADREEMLAAKKEASAKVTADANKARKTRKEENDSLYQAYLSMMSEEGCDARKDKEQERKGTDARTDYSKPPAAGNDFGKKKPMSDEDRSAAMAKVVANLKKKGGK